MVHHPVSCLVSGLWARAPIQEFPVGLCQTSVIAISTSIHFMAASDNRGFHRFEIWMAIEKLKTTVNMVELFSNILLWCIKQNIYIEMQWFICVVLFCHDVNQIWWPWHAVPWHPSCFYRIRVYPQVAPLVAFLCGSTGHLSPDADHVSVLGLLYIFILS